MFEVTGDHEAKILIACRNGLRRKTPLEDRQCFIVAAPAYVLGQPDFVVQISPGPTTPDTLDEGGQPGGGVLVQRMQIDFTVFARILMDLTGTADEALARESEGLLSRRRALEKLLRFTTLGGLTLGPLRWEGGTGFSWYNVDQGLAMGTFSFSAAWAEELPDSITLTEQDVA